MMSMVSAMCSVASGSTSAGATPSARRSAFIASVYCRATSAAVRFSASALRMILSSTSVTLRTNRRR